MSACDDVKRAIPDFPAYVSQMDRRRADELVRSYAGERVAALEERLQPLPADLAGACAALLMRTGFIDQDAFKDFEYAVLDDAATERFCQADLALLALADRAESITSDTLASFLGDLGAALDVRERLMTAAGTESPG